MVREDNLRAVAHAFADALDRNDFESAATMLAPACKYDLTTASLTSEGTLVGPDAILESSDGTIPVRAICLTGLITPVSWKRSMAWRQSPSSVSSAFYTK